MTKRIVVVMLAVGLCAPMAQGGLNATGDVIPADPATWTPSTHAFIGKTAWGSVTVDGGSNLPSYRADIGFWSGSTGVVTVTGAASTWTNSWDLHVGRFGDGTLNITDDGAVAVTQNIYVAMEPGSVGAINFDNGTLTTGGFLGAVTDLSGTGTINANDLVSDVDLVFDATHGLTQTLVFNGPGQNITVNLDVDGSGPMGAGYNGSGSMHIADGVTVQSTYGKLGYQSGSTGAATITGPDSTWTNSSSLSVGLWGDGTLGITNAGAVSSTVGCIGENSGSTGAVTVTGAGSTWTNSAYLYVGFYGGGTLDITAAASVEVGGNTGLGLHPGSSGEIHFDSGTLTTGGFLGAVTDLSGTGTIHTNGLVSDVDLVFDATHGLTQTLTLNAPGQNITVYLDVDGSAPMGAGYGGDGSLHIADAVVVQSTSACIGDGSASTGVVTVDGAGSTWANSGALYVGYYGSGTLDITDGGTVSGTQGFIGYKPGSTGVVTVSGAASTWSNSSTLNVGNYESSGTLNITADADVSSSCAYIGPYSGSTGVVTVHGAGSTWTNSSSLYIGRYGGNGTLRLYDGGMANVAGDATFFSGATLEFGLSGALVESYLDVTGLATLTGALDITLLPGLVLTPGNEFVIVDAASLSGTFGALNFPNAQEWYIDYDMPAGDVTVGFVDWSVGNFDQDQDIDATDIDLLGDAIRLGSTDFALFDISADGTTGGTDGLINVNDLDYLVHQLVETTIGTGTEYGDFNLDGITDTTDLTRLATNYGPGTMWSEGNANRNIDLTTDVTDLTILATYFGFGVPDVVPEPATLSLLALGACLPLLRKRR